MLVSISGLKWPLVSFIFKHFFNNFSTFHLTLERYIHHLRNFTQNFDANSTNVTKVRTNKHTNGQIDKRNDENYIPVGINAGGIIKDYVSHLSRPPWVIKLLAFIER